MIRLSYEQGLALVDDADFHIGEKGKLRHILPCARLIEVRVWGIGEWDVDVITEDGARYTCFVEQDGSKYKWLCVRGDKVGHPLEIIDEKLNI